jgi:hypothetical protein
MKVKELIQALYEFNDEDIVVLSACDENGDETDLFNFYIDTIETEDIVVLSTCNEDGDEVDLFNFYIDAIQNCEFIDGKKFTEVRICQLPHQKID